LKKLVGPLLKRRPELAYGRRMVFLRPLTHYLCGAYFISGFYGQYFSIVALVDQLFDGGGEHPLLNRTIHNKALEKHVDESWLEDRNRASEEVSDIIEQDLLPAVVGVTEPRDHLDSPTFPLTGARSWSERAFSACYYGDFDAAQEWADKCADKDEPVVIRENLLDLADDDLKFHPSVEGRCIYLSRLLRHDRNAVIPLLHEWEMHKVRKLKLEKYWQPTPFPCEQ